jgi:hypothetical protein
MADHKALFSLRKNLDSYIRADPISVQLSRARKQKTAAGGYVKEATTTLPAQQFRLVPFSRRLSDFTNPGQVSGYVPTLKYALVGRWDADILRDDEFDYNGDHYKVVSVEPKSNDRTNTDRVVAEVTIEPSAQPLDP